MKQTYIYLIHDPKSKAYKIGKSDNPFKRLATLQTGNANKLKLIATFLDNEASELELHEELEDYWIDGEWFRECDDVVNTYEQWCDAAISDTVSMYSERENNPLPRTYRQMKIVEEMLLEFKVNSQKQTIELTTALLDLALKNKLTT